MFGGVGLFHNERIFGLIARDTLYFKVDASNAATTRRATWIASGPSPINPIEHDVLRGAGGHSEDADACVEWARKSTPSAQRRRRRGEKVLVRDGLLAGRLGQRAPHDDHHALSRIRVIC